MTNNEGPSVPALMNLFVPPDKTPQVKNKKRIKTDEKTPLLLQAHEQPLNDSHEYDKENKDGGHEGRRAFLNHAEFSKNDNNQKGSAGDDPKQEKPGVLIWWKGFAKQHLQPTTFAGAFMFLLYHVVFCLALGSAITRPNSPGSILGPMAKTGALGIIFAAPLHIFRLGEDIPAIYPSIDLFLAPFLAEAAASVDKTLIEESGEDYPDLEFFATFAVITAIGMALSGGALLLGATFKLANLGSFLPYSVLCGFFSAVGVLLWALSFSVDTNGKNWKDVFFSGDIDLICDSLLHHFPALVIGILMNRLGPRHPFYVVLLIILTVATFYIVIWTTGASLKDAQDAGWFWNENALVYDKSFSVGLHSWVEPPAPFSMWYILFWNTGVVNWVAVQKGLSSMTTLAFLYLLRSSIHASALKKNISNLVRKEPRENISEVTDKSSSHDMASSLYQSIRISIHQVNASLALPSKPSSLNRKDRKESENLDIDDMVVSPQKNDEPPYDEIRAKMTGRSLEEIFIEYGYGLLLVAGVGGFGNCPTVATSNTMYAIGADGPAPQYGSVLLLVIFYMTDFSLVQYIPKAAFSALLVLGAVDTFVVWFYLSFRKTQDIFEWLVCPAIVVFSLVVGFLEAVFLGAGISLFVFVGSFFKVGVVKYNATGLEIRSTVERSPDTGEWLDTHGDLIQVLVLQNYLFFGNASSILNYIATMFEEVDEKNSINLNFSIAPLPRVLVIDFSLITGMDTSTVDIFNGIKELCNNNECKLFLSGLPSRMRQSLALGGVKPDSSKEVVKRMVRFFPDLESALGKAEDALVRTGMNNGPNDDYDYYTSEPKNGDSGFVHALKKVDEQHYQDFSSGLVDLEPYTIPLVLQPGEKLYESDGGKVCYRGLFFIESGLLKIEKDHNSTVMTRSVNRSSFSRSNSRSSFSRSNSRSNLHSISKLHARTGDLARKAASIKMNPRSTVGTNRTFRLARIGPGWVVGIVENALGYRNPGVHIAVSRCKLHCIPFHKIAKLEEENPLLLLRLYKLMSHLMARRQELTIDQLATLHSIMSSPAHKKPVSRAAIRAFS